MDVDESRKQTAEATTQPDTAPKPLFKPPVVEEDDEVIGLFSEAGVNSNCIC